jgi:hypothetical protein
MIKYYYFVLGLIGGACIVFIYMGHIEKQRYLDSDAIRNWSLHHSDIYLPKDSIEYYRYHEYPPVPNRENIEN